MQNDQKNRLNWFYFEKNPERISNCIRLNIPSLQELYFAKKFS